MPSPRTLVVFYSRDGHTRKAAQAVAGRLGCDIIEIIDTVSRRGLWGFLRAGFDAAMQHSTTIKPLTSDPAGYDLVVIGTPNWASKMSCATRRFILEYRPVLGRVAFLVTQSDPVTRHGARLSRIVESLSALCARTPAATLELGAGDFRSGAWVRLIEDFCDRLRT